MTYALPDWFEWGGWRVENGHLVSPQKLRLRRTEAAILRELMGAGWVSHTHLLEAGVTRTEAGLRAAMRDLRVTLGKRAIETARGRGYRLVKSDFRTKAASNPALDLVRALETALVAARRLEKTIRLEGN